MQESGDGYILDHRSNDSIKAMNRLLAKGYEVSWIKEGFTHENVEYASGAILVKGGGSLKSDLQAMADELGSEFPECSVAVQRRDDRAQSTSARDVQTLRGWQHG